MINFSGPKRHEEQGFSLIEVAIFLLILGLLMVPTFHLLELERKNNILSQATGSVDYVRSALSKYAIEKGRYPLPAVRNLDPEDPAFGVEWAGAIGACTVAGGDTNPCRIVSGTRRALVGDVPVKELGINVEHIVDGWGGKVTYVVTERLTKVYDELDPTNTFDEDGGEVIIQRLNGNNEPQTNANAHFVIVGHGQNNLGTFSLYGTFMGACPTGANANRDTINCTYDDMVFTTNSADVTTEDGLSANRRQQSLAQGGDYYDDYLSFATNTQGHIWSFSVGSPDMENRNPGNVMIGAHSIPTRPSVAVAKLEVMGDVSTDMVATNRLCPISSDPKETNELVTCPAPIINTALESIDPYHENVFDPAIITVGTKHTNDYGLTGGGIRCRGEGLRGIANADEECVSNFPSSFPSGSFSCASGSFPKGIDSDGNLICIVPPVGP